MNKDPLTLQPINDLLDKPFYIPAYQRGYRWTARQVRELLEDISAFRDETAGPADKKLFYCLQPVVVVSRPDGMWELIDGQQRLTTVRLIITALKVQATALEKTPFTLEYETREDSAEFLNNINPAQADDNIDYSHIYTAYKTITDWFDGQDGGRKMSFLQCLLNTDKDGKNVKVIWYELPTGQNAVDAFVRLNMGKIPLTNSELIRALFLRAQNFEKNDVTLRQLQIAQEWDNIEKMMQSSDFWGFIYGGTDAYPARIEYLFELITAEMDGDGVLEEDAYGTFIIYNRYFESLVCDSRKTKQAEQSEHADPADQAWRDVKNYFMTCEEWFRDRTLYHLVGYLITRGVSVKDLKRLAVNRGKSAFQGVLKQQVFLQFFEGLLEDHKDRDSLREVIEEALCDLSYERNAQHRDIRSALLLFNIATLLQNPTSPMRFPFNCFKAESWDLEHIKSVKSEMPSRRDNQKAWVQTVFDFWQQDDTSVSSVQDEKRVPILERMQRYLDTESMSLEKSTELFQVIYDDVLDYYEESGVTEVDNGIQNLTLLDAGTNRSYKNAVFPIKRDRVRRLDKTGTFVPICTTNVFLKYYSKNVDRMLFWTERDRADYFASIVDTLTDFFMDKKGDNQ